MQQPVHVQTSGATYVGSRSGLAYRLGQEIGAGGNGIVYTVSRRPELVAKIEKYPLAQHDVDKLDVLVRAATPELLAVAAWPTDLLKSANGQVVGFVMPRILDARPLYELYSPRSRIQQFPSADFRFLVHAAANVARLFAAVHQAGFICGDVNHSNILVRQTATVAAVDCDSFQVGDGSRFPCLVGTELFVPPELMGATLGATRRTANHDNFGLAVLIFHLLFMGRHPFAGRFLGRGEMPIERAIAESRFAYSRDDTRTQMAPPPFTPPMTTAGPAVAGLFELAFHPNARKGARPPPEAWIDALEALKASIVQCRSVAWHHHPPSIATCPWCAIEAPARIKLFGGVIKVAAAVITDLETLWARYLALAEPGPPRPLPVLPARPRWRRTLRRPQLSSLPAPRKVFDAVKHRVLSFAGRVRGDNVFWAVCAVYFTAKFYWAELGAMAQAAPEVIGQVLAPLLSVPWNAISVGGAALLMLLAGPMVFSILGWMGLALLRLFLRPPMRTSVTRGRGLVVRASGGRRDAKRAWAKAAADWEALPPPPDISDLKTPVETLKKQLDDLATEREAEIRGCAKPESAEAQLVRYLGGLRIEDAKMPNIGPARCAVLRSWGIDTAADVDAARISEIPGFGKNLTEKLVIWREIKEKGFVPSTASIIDPHELQRIDRRLAGRRMRLMKELRERIAEVERRMTDYVKDKQARWARVEAAYKARLTS